MDYVSLVVSFERDMKKSLFLLLILACGGCYQINSDDDLRSVPVTNNPNILPANLREQAPIGPFMSSATAGDRECYRQSCDRW